MADNPKIGVTKNVKVDVRGDMAEADASHYAYIQNKQLYPTLTYCNAWYAQKGIISKVIPDVTYILISADKGSMLFFNNANPIILTIPISLPADFTCGIVQLGAGIITLTASGTIILNADNFTKTKAKGAVVSIFQTPTANTFITVGQMQ